MCVATTSLTQGWYAWLQGRAVDGNHKSLLNRLYSPIRLHSDDDFSDDLILRFVVLKFIFILFVNTFTEHVFTSGPSSSLCIYWGTANNRIGVIY